jgi:ATP-binding cassette subfamily F protein uup
MSLINLDNVSIAFGHVTLLDQITLRLDKGERVCLIGRNGEGKSTLLKIISGEILPDQGRVERQTSGCIIAQLAQEPHFNPTDTVFHAVAAALGSIGQLVEEYHILVQQLAHNQDARLMAQLETVQHHLEAQDGWRLEQRVETTLSRLQLPPDVQLSALSGGWRRRVALAQVLVTDPDLLLLDEPTNHLDLDTITWLEQFLLEYNGTLLFVSHDRSFMQRLATRIIELDRGQLTSYPGDYATYLSTKEAALAAEATQAAKFDKYLAQEEVWIRQGIKARRTRNEGRVRALERLRQERLQRREQQGTIRLNLDGGELSGKIVIEADTISKSYPQLPLVRDFSTVIMRGDRIGLIGPNGAGKTTLLKLLLGELPPDSGTVKHGTHLSITYFDQAHSELNPNDTVIDAISQGREVVTINGQNKHIMSYLADFLFPTARAYSPVHSLSGGERNRVLLARLFAKPANVLVMDEPTNDLDVESLELLEDLLANYPATLLLVSHDRSFLDNVVTSTLVFEGAGRVTEYPGGYQDWLSQRPVVSSDSRLKPPVQQKLVRPAKYRTRKLSYHEQRELTELPAKIDVLETDLAELQTLLSQSDFYRNAEDKINQTLARIKQVKEELARVSARWEELEAIAG